MFGLGIPELIIILAILLLLFGSTKLPKLSRSIGESVREMREGLSGQDNKTDKPKPPVADKQETKEAS